MVWANNQSGFSIFNWVNIERGGSLLQSIPDIHIGNGPVPSILDMIA